MKLREVVIMIIANAFIFLGSAWAYTNVMEGRLIRLETIQEQQIRIIEKQEERLRKSEDLLLRMTSLEEFIHMREKAPGYPFSR